MAEYNCSTNPYPLRATNMKLAPVPAAMVALQDSVRLVLYTARHSLTGTVISRATALPGVEFHNQSRSSGMVRVLCGIGFQALARRILRTLLVVSLPAASAFAAENPLTVYTEDNFLHSRPVERDGELYVEGFASDLVRAVLQQAGFESEIVVLPWPRLMRSLETEPDTLAFMMTRTPDREDRFIWIGLIRPVSFNSGVFGNVPTSYRAHWPVHATYASVPCAMMWLPTICRNRASPTWCTSGIHPIQ